MSSKYQQSFTIVIDSDIKDLIPNFLSGRKKDITTIRSLLVDGNFELIQSIGHTLKGNGSGYGFDGISEIGKEIELAAIDPNPTQIQQKLKELESYIEHVKIEFG